MICDDYVNEIFRRIIYISQKERHGVLFVLDWKMEGKLYKQ